MKRITKITLIIISIILILLLIWPIRSTYNFSVQEKAVEKNQKWMCNLIVGKSKSLICLMGCDYASTQICLSKFDYKIAIRADNMEVCEELKSYKILCYDHAYSRLAKKSNDASICENIQDKLSRLVCTREIAIEKKEPLLCEEMEELESRDSCFSTVAFQLNNVSICENILNVSPFLEGGTKNDCYALLAEKNKDPSICNKILDQERLDLCSRWAISGRIYDGSK